jgi:hypothetical protein
MAGELEFTHMELGVWAIGRQGPTIYACMCTEKESSYSQMWKYIREGCRHGRGTLTYADASTYEGESNANCSDGQGTVQYANGSTYKGKSRKGRSAWPWDSDPQSGGTPEVTNPALFQDKPPPAPLLVGICVTLKR